MGDTSRICGIRPSLADIAPVMGRYRKTVEAKREIKKKIAALDHALRELERKRKAAKAEFEADCVGEPKGWTGWVPIYADIRTGINDWQHGRYGWAVANIALGVSDVGGVVGALKSLGKGVARKIGGSAVKAGAKEGAERVARELAEKSLKAAAKQADEIAAAAAKHSDEIAAAAAAAVRRHGDEAVEGAVRVAKAASKGIPVTPNVVKDGFGRIISSKSRIVKGNLYGGTGTTAAARKLASGGDDAGHIIGKLLGGRGGASSDNILSQLPAINRGSFRKHERWVADQIMAGSVVDVNIRLVYRGGAKRPVRIIYTTIVDGVKKTIGFPN